MEDNASVIAITILATAVVLYILKRLYFWGENTKRNREMDAAYRLKYNFLSELLIELKIPTQTHRLNVNELVLYQEITNKVKNVGRHYYKVIDSYEMRENQYGKYKESHYMFIVKTYINPNIEIELRSAKFQDKEELKVVAKGIIQDHFQSSKVKEALQLHNF